MADDTDTLDPQTEADKNPKTPNAIGSRLKGAVQGLPKGGLKGAAMGALKKPSNSGSKKSGTKPPSGGQKAAGNINKAADFGEKRGAEALGTALGGTAGKEIGSKVAGAKQAIEKKLTGGNEEARLALRAAEALGPVAPILIGIGIFVLLIIIFIVVIFGGTAAGDPNKGPKLTLNKTGPTTASAGAQLTYQVNIAYPGKAQDIIIKEAIPEGTDFVSSSWPAHCDPAPCDPTKSRLVYWNAKENIPLTGGYLVNPSTTLAVILKATRDNDFVVNQAEGVVIGEVIDTPPEGGGVPGAPCGQSNTSTNNFDELLAGQGRCVNILGDENSFVSKVVANGGSRGMAGKEDYLRQIYQKATAKKVNPLIILAIWGVEQSFNTSGGIYNFGCLSPAKTGFALNLECAVNSMDNGMIEFDQLKAAGTFPVPIVGPKATCYYTDPFLWEYEWYTPVCHANDGNDNAHGNFVTYYKLFLGVQ